MNQSVLIVDDSLTVRMDLADAFEAAGLHTVPCSTLAQAHDAMAHEKIGVVVLDVMLPDGDGVDFLRELRAPQAGVSPRVIMLSSEIEVKDRIRGLAMGADEYVGKPYSTDHVVARARELLRGAETARPETAATPDEIPVTAERPTVLVIDDSATFRESLSAALREAGYEVVAAGSAAEGLQRVATSRPKAIVVDGVMPDMDGAALIRHVRLDSAHRGIPCLLLTAEEDSAAQLRALEAGADAFVRKDGDFDLILARLAAVLRQAHDPAEALAKNAGPHKVLAVDDSATYLNMLAETLRDDGYEVLTAHSGEEAIELLAVQPVDCILMDVMMPGIGGKEACRRIKNAQSVRDTPLILLTALEDRAAMLEGLSAGADDYIPKSSEFDVLRARVRAQIRRKQFEDENRQIRDQLLSRELEAAEERAARRIAETRADMVEELERLVEERSRALEAEVVERRHAERMASVGMLSASIAHEINNPLAVVIGNLDIIAMTIEQVTESCAEFRPGDAAADAIVAAAAERLSGIKELLTDSLEASERVREIVRDLRIFSRSEDAEANGAVDIHRVLASSIRMASNEIRHRADLVEDFGDVPPVVGNETRLGQIFLNLIVNAAQAIPEGRPAGNVVTVATRPSSPGHVVVEIRDTGVGIPADKLERVFDPFFTTKPAGIGTGLGLAICHRIVGELGGRIEVESTVDVGTTFRVILRVAGSEPAAIEKPAPAARAAAGGRVGRILVVDDEPSLGKMIDTVLSSEHEVIAVTSAREALARIEAGDNFDAILSDVMMPEMSGRALYNRLTEIAPDLAAKVIFMTGGAFSADSQAFLQQTGRPVVEKPFKPSVLKQRIRDLVG